MQFTYDEAVNYISEVPRFTKKNEAGNTKELLRRIGNPQEMFEIVHVAGTNGKGSVCAFMAEAFQRAGRRTGLFISPHLVRINERFQINRENISDERFLTSFIRVKEAIDAMVSDGFSHPTYFEILFALGMAAFAEEKIDILVMETGLGGRLDATNTVEHPRICVITSISLDHTEYLGDTVEKIAGEKAGIIKAGVPVVYDASDTRAAHVIEKKALEIGSEAIPVYPAMAQIVSYSDEGITYVLNNRQFDYLEVKIPFLADYQVMNSALALTALKICDSEGKMSLPVLKESLASARWSGRMEKVSDGIIFDGAHNSDGIREFLKTVKRISETKRTALLFAAVVEKDYEDMIKRLATEVSFDYIVVTEIEGSRKVDADRFASIFRKYTSAPVTAISNAGEAFKYAREHRNKDQVLFCAGSLYLIGELEKELELL